MLLLQFSKNYCMKRLHIVCNTFDIELYTDLADAKLKKITIYNSNCKNNSKIFK